MLGCVIILLFSAYTTYVEIRYMVSGRTASAAITSVEEMRGAGRNTQSFVRVKYTFADTDESDRNEFDDMASDWVAPAASSVSVQFLSGKPGWSRIAGHGRLWMTVPFLLCLTVVTAFLVRFYREFQAHERRKASW